MADAYLNPFDARQQSIARRRQLALFLQQQSFDPIEAPNYPGAQSSNWQGIAKLAQALMGGLANRKLDKEQAALNQDTLAARKSSMAEAISPFYTPPPQSVNTGAGPSMDIAPPAPATMNPEAQQTAGMLASGDPVTQQLGQALFSSTLSGRTEAQKERAAMARELMKPTAVGPEGLYLPSPGGGGQIIGQPGPKNEFSFERGTPGQPFGAFNKTRGTFNQLGTEPMPSRIPGVDEQELLDYLKKNPDKGPMDFAKFKGTLGQRPQRQVLWGDDPNNPGKQIPFEYDENARTVTPIAVQRTPNAQLNAVAKEESVYEEAMNSVAAMEGLAKRKTYAADQALGDQFFNVVKPGTGARMNQTQIERFMTPGPLKSKMVAWAQKLDQGQPLDDAARQDLVESARIVATSKKPKASTPTSPAASGLPSVGGTFNGAKVLKVTPIP